MKKLEFYDLKALGCSEKAIDLKYSNSDSEYFLNGDEITEKLRGVELVCTLKKDDFVECFNNLSEFEN